MSTIAPTDEQQKLAEVSTEIADVVTRAARLEVACEQDARDATAFLAELKAAKDRSERARRFLVDPLNAHVKAINGQMKEALEPLLAADGQVRAKLLAFRRVQERERECERARLEAARLEAERSAAEERRKAQEAAADADRTAAKQHRLSQEQTPFCWKSTCECREWGEETYSAWEGLALWEEHAGVATPRREAEEATQRHIAAASAPAPKAAALAPLKADSGSAVVRHEWNATVVDPDAVPREYLVVDMAKVRAAVKDGVREIPGVRIEQVESLAVRGAPAQTQTRERQATA